jgi:hypothetical protein
MPKTPSGAPRDRCAHPHARGNQAAVEVDQRSIISHVMARAQLMAERDQRRNACAWLPFALSFPAQVHDRPQESARVLRPATQRTPCSRRIPTSSGTGTGVFSQRHHQSTSTQPHSDPIWRPCLSALRTIKKSNREETLAGRGGRCSTHLHLQCRGADLWAHPE